jgi:hypothetical protein
MCFLSRRLIFAYERYQIKEFLSGVYSQFLIQLLLMSLDGVLGYKEGLGYPRGLMGTQ